MKNYTRRLIESHCGHKSSPFLFAFSSCRETIARVIALAANRIRNTEPSRSTQSHATLSTLSSVIFDRVLSRLCKWRTRGGVVARSVTRLCVDLCPDVTQLIFHRDAVGIHKTFTCPSLRLPPIPLFHVSPFLTTSRLESKSDKIRDATRNPLRLGGHRVDVFFLIGVSLARRDNRVHTHCVFLSRNAYMLQTIRDYVTCVNLEKERDWKVTIFQL